MTRQISEVASPLVGELDTYPTHFFFFKAHWWRVSF